MLSTLLLLAPLTWGATVAYRALGDRTSPLAAGLLVAAVVASFALVAADHPSFAIASGILGAHLLGLWLIDAELSEVPDLLTIPLVITGLIHAWWSLDALLPHAATAGTLGLTLGFLSWRRPDLIGSGDVLIIAGLGAWLGPLGTPDALMIAALALAAFMLLHARRHMPFAPALGLGGWTVWLFGPVLSQTMM